MLILNQQAAAQRGRQGQRESRTERAPAMQPGEHPRLVITRDDIPAMRQKVSTPEGKAMLARLQERLQQPPLAIDIGFHAAGHALLYVLSGDKKHAENARSLVEKTMADELLHDAGRHGKVPLWGGNYKMIIRTDPAVGVALAYDLCFDAWEPAFRERVAGELDKKAQQFIKGGGEGWNGSPASNWHANTRSAAGICALAVLGDAGAPNAQRSVDAAMQGVRNYFRAQSGDRGWTQESFSYYRYPMNHHVLPFIQIYRNMAGSEPDPFRDTPADWLALFFVHLLLPEPAMGHVPIVNGHPLWENNHFRSGDFSMGMGTVTETARRAFLSYYDKWFGLTGDRTFDIFLPHHAIFAFKNYPVGVQPVNPEKHLAKVWEDRKKGLYIFRDRWEGNDDFITVFDMVSHSAPGTGQPEVAGSYRIFGLGGKWATIGAARGRAGQNVVHVEGGVNARGTGRRTFFEGETDGSGVLSVDLRAVYKEPSLRSFAVDYSGAAGVPALFAIVDKHEKGGNRTWVLHSMEPATVNGNQFQLRAANGATLVGTVVAPAGARLAVREESATFSGASREGEETHKIYRIEATGDQSFFVVMTVQKGSAPVVSITGTGLDATVKAGGRTVSFDGGKIEFGK
jgi:hypothetical protein